MVAGSQFRKFSRSGSANEEQDARALTLCFVDTERDGSSLASGRNGHQKLTGTRHIDDVRSVKTKEEHAGRELLRIENNTFVHCCWHRLQGFAPPMRHTSVTQFLIKSATFD